MTAHDTSATSMPRVALLGTGTMGAPMGRNIASAGLPLTVWNRTAERARPLSDDGATLAQTPAEAVRGADLVVTMVFDIDSVLEVMDQAADALPAGAVWLQMSTIGVDGTEQVVALAERLGLRLLDAPVLGTKQPAEAGELVVLASGERDLADIAAPVFDAVGGRTVWVDGGIGASSRLKLAVNAWVLTMTDGIAQSLALCEALGIEPQTFLDTVKGGAMDAPYVHLKGGAMLSGSLDASFGLDGGIKDAGLIVAAANAAGLQPGLMAAVRADLQLALDAGHGDKDRTSPPRT